MPHRTDADHKGQHIGGRLRQIDARQPQQAGQQQDHRHVKQPLPDDGKEQPVPGVPEMVWKVMVII